MVRQITAFDPPPAPVARQLPSAASAVQLVQADLARPSAAQPVGRKSHVVIPGPAGPLLARVYTPRGRGPFPVLV